MNEKTKDKLLALTAITLGTVGGGIIGHGIKGTRKAATIGAACGCVASIDAYLVAKEYRRLKMLDELEDAYNKRLLNSEAASKANKHQLGWLNELSVSYQILQSIWNAPSWDKDLLDSGLCYFEPLRDDEDPYFEEKLATFKSQFESLTLLENTIHVCPVVRLGFNDLVSISLKVMYRIPGKSDLRAKDYLSILDQAFSRFIQSEFFEKGINPGFDVTNIKSRFASFTSHLRDITDQANLEDGEKALYQRVYEPLAKKIALENTKFDSAIDGASRLATEFNGRPKELNKKYGFDTVENFACIEIPLIIEERETAFKLESCVQFLHMLTTRVSWGNDGRMLFAKRIIFHPEDLNSIYYVDTFGSHSIKTTTIESVIEDDEEDDEE